MWVCGYVRLDYYTTTLRDYYYYYYCYYTANSTLCTRAAGTSGDVVRWFVVLLRPPISARTVATAEPDVAITVGRLIV